MPEFSFRGTRYYLNWPLSFITRIAIIATVVVFYCMCVESMTSFFVLICGIGVVFYMDLHPNALPRQIRTLSLEWSLSCPNKPVENTNELDLEDLKKLVRLANHIEKQN